MNVPKLLAAECIKLGVKAEVTDLQYGDIAFEGHGPDGDIAIGIERKTLHDMLNCIDDARLAGHQLIGMRQLYKPTVLLLEGHWKPHDPQGMLMEGFNGGNTWGFCKYRSQRTMYSKLYRYLISVSLTGVIITRSRDLFQTAYDCCEWYHYFQKPWNQHRSQREIHKVALPSMRHKPALVRRWAAALEDVGVELSERAERVFRSPIKLANADESEWLRVPGVGVKTAQAIVREIWKR